MLQDNFNLKEENNRLRERILEVERDVSQNRQEEEWRREALPQSDRLVRAVGHVPIGHQSRGGTRPASCGPRLELRELLEGADSLAEKTSVRQSRHSRRVSDLGGDRHGEGAFNVSSTDRPPGLTDHDEAVDVVGFRRECPEPERARSS